MKKLLLIPAAAALILSSCGGGGCDPATAQGAAACLCEMQKAAKDSEGDKDKAMKMMEEYGKKMEEIEKNIKDGKYTENDVEAAAGKIDGCKL